MLQVIFARASRTALGRGTTCWAPSNSPPACATSTPSAPSDGPASRAETVREIARSFAARPSAAAYGRTGSCLGRFGTLVAYLLDALNAVTGNLDRPGGAVFGRPPIALDEIAEKAGLATYGKVRSRFGDYPRRDREPARDADTEGDHDARRAPDPRVLRVGRQPRALGARRRGARGGLRASSTCSSRSTST